MSVQSLQDIRPLHLEELPEVDLKVREDAIQKSLVEHIVKRIRLIVEALPHNLLQIHPMLKILHGFVEITQENVRMNAIVKNSVENAHQQFLFKAQLLILKWETARLQENATIGVRQIQGNALVLIQIPHAPVIITTKQLTVFHR